MAHAKAKLNEYARMLLVTRLETGWTQAQVAEAQGVSRSTVAKWWKRYREEGVSGLKDRSSRARRLPHSLGVTVIEAICQLRRELGAGPHRIAYHLKMAASTVSAGPGCQCSHASTAQRVPSFATSETIQVNSSIST